MHLLPPFTRALMRRPAANFADGLTRSTHRGAPNYALALQQFEAYAAALRACGLTLTIAPADERFPDGHFVEDPFVIFGDLAFRCRSGAAARRGEGDSLKPYLSQLRLVEPPPNARIDGGDVLFCADRVLVGIAERTNAAGFHALRNAILSAQPGVRIDPVPFSGVLHLKSGLTELAPNVLIRDPALRTDYDFDWAQVIVLPPDEGHAADLMPVNDTLFVAANCPAAYDAATKHCKRVETLDLGEFVKMDGGLTCLSLRY